MPGVNSLELQPHMGPNTFSVEALVEGLQVRQVQRNAQRKHSVAQLSSQKIPRGLLQK